MATTELEKIPETVLSRSQVYELRTIGTRTIAEQLRRIVDAEKIEVGDDSLQLIARDAEGSLRDAQSKLDQVIAFTGTTITADDVATVLGLVGRDLPLDAVKAVADEDAAAAFAVVARAVEMGYELRAVVRELLRVTRDLLVLSVDPGRIADPEIAGEGERERLQGLVARFSREDLLRAFELLTRADADIRGAAQPRYHLEMALLRWIYLRKLVPIEDLLASAGRLPAGPPPTRSATASAERSSATPAERRPDAQTPMRPEGGDARATLKDALLAEIRKSKAVFYNTVVAQAQKIEIGDDRVTFTFSATQRALREQFEQNRGWLEAVALQASGRRMGVSSAQTEADAQRAADAPRTPPPDPVAAKKSTLREQALADAGVQALLEVFPAEIRDIEEM
jgi:DNA polymerase III gamma/tau subunit